MHLFLRRCPALGGLQLFALLCLLGLGMPPATGGKLAFSRTQAREQLRRTLTFAERAAYQYAIEEVHWRHRIWPRSGGENPGPKPPLDAIVSQRQIEHKVEEYISLQPGAFTAILAGKNGGTGVGLVEIYNVH
jgi:hypothetical protein